MNLGGVEVADVHRGDTLTAAGAFAVTRRFDAIVELLPDGKALRHGARVRFHHGTAELLARVALASEEGEPAEDRGTPLAELQPGRRAFARIRLERPAVLARGDRFVIRQYSPPITIGGGTVLDPLPARTPVRTPAAVRRFARLASSDADAAMAFVEESRTAGMAADALARRAGAAPSGAVVAVGATVFSAAVVNDLEARLVAEVDAYHRAQPMSEGMPREAARERVFGPASPALFDEVVQRLLRAGKLGGRERLALPGRGVSLSDEETNAQSALERVFQEAGLSPPDIAAAASAARVAPAVADRVSKLLLRQKTLVRVDTIVFHAGALDRLKRDVSGMKGTAAKVDVATFKERYGISRKYAIPLLEWLDRERVTRRVGDARVIL